MVDHYAEVMARTEARVRLDPKFADLLGRLVDTPVGPAGELSHAAAGELNAQRQRETIRDFQSGSLATAAVQDLLGLGTPQAVHRLRSRGRLIALTIGNGTWFPSWQFADGRIRPDLDRVLELTGRFTTDPVATDRIMRIRREDLGGLSITAALERPERREAAWAALSELGA